MRQVLRATTRLLLAICSAGLLVALTALPAGAQGVDAEKLDNAGWTCVSPPGDAPTHCLPPSQFDRVVSGEARAALIMTFGPVDGEFWGTEHAIHKDLYNGQPCPQDDVGYIDLEATPLGVPYRVCHHFDSPVT